MRLHRRLGHRSNQTLVDVLKRAGADKKVLQIARTLRCPACEKHKRRDSYPVASPYIPQGPGRVIETDGFEWVDPRTQETHTFTYIVDVGTRLSGGKYECKGKSNRTAEQFIKTLRERWIRYYGKPRTVRMDSESCHNATICKNYFGEHNIYPDVIARQAHTQLALAERNIGIVKNTMSKIAEETPRTTSVEEIFDQSLDAMNDLGRYNGHSPYEMMLGRTPEPEITDIFKDGDDLPLMHNLQREEGTEYHQLLQVRLKARKSFLEVVTDRRLALLELRKARKRAQWQTGQLCYWWSEKIKNASLGGSGAGAWMGPGQVIAQEQGQDGTPGSVVWVEHCGKLLRIGLQQLREATTFEREIHALVTGNDVALMGITQAMLKVNKREYEDLMGKGPTLEDEDVSWTAEPVPAGTTTRSGENQGHVPEDVHPEGGPRGPPADVPPQPPDDSGRAEVPDPAEPVHQGGTATPVEGKDVTEEENEPSRPSTDASAGTTDKKDNGEGDDISDLDENER